MGQAERVTATVFGRSGCIVPVDPELFRSVEPAIAPIDRHVDPSLLFAPSAFEEP